MRKVYEEMFTINQTVAPLLRAQVETKKRNEQLKEASKTLNRILEWKNRYPQAPKNFPRKGWIHTQNEKVQICMKVQSKEKLFKDLETVMTTYENLISGIDSMTEMHHIPSLGTLGEEKTWE